MVPTTIINNNPVGAMRQKCKTYNKIVRVLDKLGYKYKKEGATCSFETDTFEYLIFIDEETETLSIKEYVMGLKGKLTKEEFEMALDVTKHFHKEYDGEWNDGISYFYSPAYCLKGIRTIPQDQMDKIIEEFFEAYSFMAANACMVTDDTIPWQSP